ncbi:hypothetical protein PoB_003659600 [Plakobranchus ocellatus]|uniref:Uncharacterized protein n=1 Tax=Plakobranchus ocellatus TaxID=259542 RepID=A0AAV4AFY8_9GAST|nr:hypothetical protein PoB_003659600 [Plakobranchus ocellatus]
MHSSLSCRVTKLKCKMAQPKRIGVLEAQKLFEADSDDFSYYTNSDSDSDYNPDETVDALDDSVDIKLRKKRARLSIESLTSIATESPILVIPQSTTPVVTEAPFLATTIPPVHVITETSVPVAPMTQVSVTTKPPDPDLTEVPAIFTTETPVPESLEQQNRATSPCHC